jgi:hypothetical protein
LIPNSSNNLAPLEFKSFWGITQAITAFGTECLKESITFSNFLKKFFSGLVVYAKITMSSFVFLWYLKYFEHSYL